MDTQLYSHTSKSLIEKHSVIIAKHRTSVSVEQAPNYPVDTTWD